MFDVMRSETLPDDVRQLCCEEMAVSHGIDIPFDIRMTGRMQRSVLDSYAQMIHGKSSVRIEGEHYYQGQLVKKDPEPDGKSVHPY